MEREVRGFRSLFGIALVVALLAAFGLVSGARAQTDDNQLASITIYTAICPNDSPDDLFLDCYDNPGANITYILDGTLTSTTGADGIAFFEGLDVEGVYLLEIDVPGEFTDFAAFCSDEFDDTFPFDYSTEVNGILLDLTLDDDIRCDFYIIPLDLSGLTPTATATATSTVVTLPDTGAGLESSPRGTFWPLTAALALVVVAGVALGRFRLARASAGPNR